MIKLLKSYGMHGVFSGSTARNMYLQKKPKDSDLIKISVNATLSELEKKLGDRLLGIDSNTISVKALYMGKVYALYPFKTINLINTYINITFVDSAYEDAKTQDFTIESLYIEDGSFLFLNNSRVDIDTKLINFVGDGNLRIMESKIRMIKAASLVSTLGDGWKIGQTTSDLIKANAFRARTIKSGELKEEFTKVLTEAEKPSLFFYTLKNLGLLPELFPELEKCLYIDQTNKGLHITLFQHIMMALDSTKIGQYPTEVLLRLRLAILLHDIGKPYTITNGDNGLHFYQHEFIGSLIAEQILERWGFGRAFRNSIKHLIINHLFDASPSRSIRSIKRLIQKIGPDVILELIELRRADRLGNFKDMNMTQLDKFKNRVNKILETEAPNSFTLAINTGILEESKLYIPGILEHARKMIALGALPNRRKQLLEYVTKLNQIDCPFDWAHLFKTNEQNISGEVLKFSNGEFQCGVYCDFLCKQKELSKSLLLDK